ncbi:hypothetical protein K0038_02993 [Pseudomonas syringae]|nr:hypothetical protein [Pseudomonas syringae]
MSLEKFTRLTGRYVFTSANQRRAISKFGECIQTRRKKSRNSICERLCTSQCPASGYYRQRSARPQRCDNRCARQSTLAMSHFRTRYTTRFSGDVNMLQRGAHRVVMIDNPSTTLRVPIDAATGLTGKFCTRHLPGNTATSGRDVENVWPCFYFCDGGRLTTKVLLIAGFQSFCVWPYGWGIPQSIFGSLKKNGLDACSPSS